MDKITSIERNGNGYRVQTDGFLSDFTYRRAFCELRGSELVQTGFHSGSGFVRVKLGPISLAAVSGLAEGETFKP